MFLSALAHSDRARTIVISPPPPPPKPKPLYTYKSWLRVHTDYSGPFMGKIFLLVIDAYTKWLNVQVTTTSTSTVTTELLRKLFFTYGLPDIADNATNFSREEFEAFLKSNGVKHVRTPPYHPASNGVVEHAVHVRADPQKWLKEAENRVDRDQSVTISQFTYQVTPHGSTGVSPGQLIFGCRMHTAMDISNTICTGCWRW